MLRIISCMIGYRQQDGHTERHLLPKPLGYINTRLLTEETKATKANTVILRRDLRREKQRRG